MQTHLPKIGRATTYGKRNAKKQIRILSQEALIHSQSPYPTVVIPRCKDGGIQHAVCVVDDLVFDSTQEVALKLQLETFEWICSVNDGFNEVAEAYRFDIKIGGKKWKNQEFRINSIETKKLLAVVPNYFAQGTF